MSGHSKWATTKRAKFATDAKRSSIFTRLARGITVAAREKGGNLDMNFSLRLAVDKAKAANMPKDNIERAIKKGTGELNDGTVIEQITYEGFGPGGVAILIKTLTDNRNRTVSDIKHLLNKHGGSFGATNSVQRLFSRRGIIGLTTEGFTDELELECIEKGAEDILREDDGITLICDPTRLEELKNFLDGRGIHIEFAEVESASSTHAEVDEKTREQCETLISLLEDLDDVTEVASNLS